MVVSIYRKPDRTKREGVGKKEKSKTRGNDQTQKAAEGPEVK